MVKPSGRRVKGKRLEARFAEMIRRSGLDDKAQRRAFSGAISMVRGRADILTKLPFSFEAKNQEKLKLWEFWEQAEAESTMAKPPVLVYSANYRPIMCVLKAETFLDILKEADDWKRSYKELLNKYEEKR